MCLVVSSAVYNGVFSVKSSVVCVMLYPVLCIMSNVVSSAMKRNVSNLVLMMYIVVRSAVCLVCLMLRLVFSVVLFVVLYLMLHIVVYSVLS